MQTELGLSPVQERAFGALVGALVADAAALGFHWLYDVGRIAERGGARPEFRTPAASDFAGVAGYFAHAGKRAGELSHYGEGLAVVARALLTGAGAYRVRVHQEEFRACFGSGGTWRGYIDHPTKGTLANLRAGEERAREAAEAAAMEAGVSPEVAHTITTRVLSRLRGGLSGTELLEAARASCAAPERSGALAAAAALDAAWPDASGASDQQLPALAALTPLLVVGSDEATLERAVRVTHDDASAVAWSVAVAAGLRAALAGAGPAAAVAAVSEAGGGPVAARLRDGLAVSGSAVEAMGVLGRNCALENGVPGLLLLARGAEDFAGPVRANVAAGGDSCGRALILGAILGASYGVGGERGIPYPWLAQLDGLEGHLVTCHALARLARG